MTTIVNAEELSALLTDLVELIESRHDLHAVFTIKDSPEFARARSVIGRKTPVEVSEGSIPSIAKKMEEPQVIGVSSTNELTVRQSQLNMASGPRSMTWVGFLPFVLPIFVLFVAIAEIGVWVKRIRNKSESTPKGYVWKNMSYGKTVDFKKTFPPRD